MGTTSIVEVHVADAGPNDRGGRLCLPTEVLEAGPLFRHTRLDLPGTDDASLRALVAAIDSAGESHNPPLVLLGGPWLSQIDVVRALIRRDGSLSGCRIVHCVSALDRPLRLDAPARWIHGLLLDAPPLDLERESWSRNVLPDWPARTAVVPVSPFPVRPSTDGAPRRGDAGPIVTLVVEDTGPWLALGMQAFRTWSIGGSAVCRACSALSTPRLATEQGRTFARQRCTFCGSDAIELTASVPGARLVVVRVRHWGNSPAPGMLAEWLGIAHLTQLLPPDDIVCSVPRALATADVAVVLGDPAFDAALCAALEHASGRCVTNVGGCPAIVGRQSSWDHRGHMTAYPSERELVRALARVQETSRPPSRRTRPDEQRSAAWARALTQLDRAPYVPPRTRRIADQPRTDARGD